MNLYTAGQILRAKRAARKAKRKAKAKRIGTKKPSLTKLKKLLWSLLSPAVRAIHTPYCYTCDRPASQGKGDHCGHMFPKGYAHAISAWHPGNLRRQCFHCNINLGGNGAEFAIRYVMIEGEHAFDEMRRLSRIPHKWTVPEIEVLISKIKISLEAYKAYYVETYCS